MSSIEKCGTPIIRKYVSSSEPDKKGVNVPVDEEMRFLDPYELVESVRKGLLNRCGLEKVERVSPFRANIIVRVYQVRHYKYDFGSIYNLYGADCYVRNWFKWYTENNGELFPLNRLENCIRHWLYPDEYINFNTEFIDIYFRGK